MNSEAIKYIAKITDLQTRAEVGSHRRIRLPPVFHFQGADAGPFVLLCEMQYI
jgi:hypothetical protein